MDNYTTSGSVGELKEESNLIIYIFGLIQGDTLDVLAAHLPIQLAKRYGEKMCFVKYHVSEDQSSIVRMSGGVQTLRNCSAYKEPT